MRKLSLYNVVYRSFTFLSPEAALLLVSTKNRDSWCCPKGVRPLGVFSGWEWVTYRQLKILNKINKYLIFVTCILTWRDDQMHGSNWNLECWFLWREENRSTRRKNLKKILISHYHASARTLIHLENSEKFIPRNVSAEFCWFQVKIS